MIESLQVEPALPEDLDALVELEDQCFATDRISRRSMRRFIQNEHSILLVAKTDDRPVGYVLLLFYRGTRLARLYSIAVTPDFRRQGIARTLVGEGETAAVVHGAIHVRLEVQQQNVAAIALFNTLAFQEFGLFRDYYEDHSDALRMQKRIRHHSHNAIQVDVPWLNQNTAFTCGPASLMMAMAGLDPGYRPTIETELQIWRETTTIFMTSGHGGCHPFGLALAASHRGFQAEVWVNQTAALFTEGVRSAAKKSVISTVHADFEQQARNEGIPIHIKAIDLETLRLACDRGAIPIVLISTYRLDQRKSPHWVVVTGYDERCIYVHDPDLNPDEENPRDLQHVPIANEDFGSMASYGRSRMRTAIVVSR